MQLNKKTGLEWLTIPFLLKVNAKRFPEEKEAIVDYTHKKRFNWRQSDLRSNKVANALLKLGIKDGDKVAFLSRNRAEILHLIYGASKIGAVIVTLNYRLGPPQWINMINHSDSIALFCEDDLIGQIDSHRADIPKIKHYVGIGEKIPSEWLNFEDMVDKASDKDPAYESKYNDIISIMYTSGTTGEPKGIMRTQGSWLGIATGQIFHEQYVSRSRIWTLMDLCHAGGFVFALSAPLLVGCTAVLLDRFEPRKALEMIEREKVDCIVPTYTGCDSLTALPQADKDRYEFSHVKHIWASGSAWPHENFMATHKMFPNGRISHGISSTEGTTALYEHEEMIEQFGPDTRNGPAEPGVELMITDLDGVNELPEGQAGLVWFRGITAADSVYKNPELEKTIMKPGGWITAEDCGFIDPKTKVLWFTDRRKDIVRSGAENVPTGAVEQIINSHPKVARCGVIGTPDAKLGETVTAIVQLKPGETMTAEELIEWCRPRMPGSYRPRRVEFVAQLPLFGFKNLPDKKLLRKQYGEKYKL